MSFIAVKTFTAGSNTSVRCFGWNDTQKYMYMLVTDGSTGDNVLYVCDDDLNYLEAWTLVDVLGPGEYIRGIRFSKNDSNILYIFSNTAVYKKFVNKPNLTIGKWLLYNAGISNSHIWNLEGSLYNKADWSWSDGGDSASSALTVTGFENFFSDDDNEMIFAFIGDANSSFNRILHYSEPTVFGTAIGIHDLKSYSISNSSLDSFEFISGIVTNKELYRVAYNTITIANYICGRYQAEYDYLNNLVHKGIEPFSDKEFSIINVMNVNDFYVHENEISSSTGPLNRCVRNIWNLQNNILQLTQTKVTNFVSSSLSFQTIILS